MKDFSFDRKVAACVFAVLTGLMSLITGHLTGWTMEPGTPTQIISVGAALLVALALSMYSGWVAQRKKAPH